MNSVQCRTRLCFGGHFAAVAFRSAILLSLAIAVLASSFFCDVAEARGPRYRGRSRGRSTAAAMAARKKQMIQATQQQVAQAQKILSAAESQTAMSEQELASALAQISVLRKEMETARLSVQEATKTLQSIEKEILDEQPPTSDYSRAQAALEKVQRELHEIVHRYVQVPDNADTSDESARYAEIAKMSPEQRQLLETDGSYQRAMSAMKDALQVRDDERKKLFEQDSQWIAAHRDLVEARKAVREPDRQAKSLGHSTLSNKQQLQQAQMIAAEARAVILQGELQLQAFGVRPKKPTGTSTKATGTSKSKR